MNGAAEGTRRKRPAFKAAPCYGNKIAKLHKDLKNPSRRGFTGLPADHVDAPRFDPDFTAREAEFLAIVYGATFHEGHRRPYACHPDGSPVDLEWIRDEMRQPISDDMVQRYSKRVQRKGYLTVEHGVFFTNGQMDLSALRIMRLGEINGELHGVRTPSGSDLSESKPLPPRVQEAIKDKDPEVQKAVWKLWTDHRDEFDKKRAALDAKWREEDAKVFESRVREKGVEVKLAVEPRVKVRPWRVEIRFVDLAQTGEAAPEKRNAHSETEGVRNPQNGSAHADATLYAFSEKTEESRYRPAPSASPSSASISPTSSSSSSSVSSEGPETTHAMGLRPRQPAALDPEKAKEPINKGEFAQLLATLCQDAGIPVPHREFAVHVFDAMQSSGERREWLSRKFAKVRNKTAQWDGPGVLLKDARTFHTEEWPAQLKRRQAEEEKRAAKERYDAGKLAEAELKSAHSDYLAELETHTDEATPAERKLAAERAEGKYVRGTWRTIGEEKRQAETLVALRDLLREKGLRFDEWKDKKEKGAGA